MVGLGSVHSKCYMSMMVVCMPCVMRMRAWMCGCVKYWSGICEGVVVFDLDWV